MWSSTRLPSILTTRNLQKPHASLFPWLTRAELLGQIMKNYKTSIGVSGTHGKTTTTSMLSMILMESQKDPTISVGGILPEIGGNIRVGHSDTFLTEACEYTNSFLSFFPTVAVILNIEEDHMDFFKDINDIRNSFHKFAAEYRSRRYSVSERSHRPSGGNHRRLKRAYRDLWSDRGCRLHSNRYYL